MKTLVFFISNWYNKLWVKPSPYRVKGTNPNIKEKGAKKTMAINFNNLTALANVTASAELKPGNYRAILTDFEINVDEYGNFANAIMSIKTTDGKTARRTFKNLKQVSYLFMVQLRGQVDELRYNDVSLLDCVKYASAHEFDFSIEDNDWNSWQFCKQPEPLTDEERNNAIANILNMK